MATKTPTFKSIESTRVAPPPNSTPDNVSLPFTFFDVYWVSFPPVERLFFYPYSHSTSHFLSFTLPSLKSSLSLTLKTYYPLAGHFRLTPQTKDKFEHYYVEGDSVSFLVVESDGKFEDFSKDQEREVSSLEFLVPELPKNEELQPLFVVQVTVFPQQGVVIGTTIHHSACDGTSSMQFMHSWAATCLSETLAPSHKVPIIDRTFISDPSNLYSVFYGISKMIKEAIEKKSESALKNPIDQVLYTFTLTQNHIQKLKKLVAKKAEETETSFHCSTIVVTFAYIWVGYVQAKGYENTKTVCFGIPADFRARIEPPIPTEYFGNCVVFPAALSQVSDLIQEDGIFFAAKAIGKAIEKINDSLKDVLSSKGKFKGVPVIGVAGSPKFRVYEIDFGIGKPVKVEIPSAMKTGSISVAESREEKGGVEIGLALPKNEMDCFKKYFFNGLELLIE
ncbi:hypothetical protein LUZ60_002419 [Juncus effusus]|nr:hypothetical protein LUZ60_002419 [Juncus effusus]